MSVIVCGLGQVGVRVAVLLLNLGQQVKVITTEALPEFQKLVEDAGGEIIKADARDSAELVRAGIGEAKSLVACTSSDLQNIEISLDARAANPQLRIVARIFDQNLATQLRNTFGIDEILAMSQLVAPIFAAEALDSQALGTFNWNQNKFTVVLGDCESPADQEFVIHEIGKLSLLKSSDKVQKPIRQKRGDFIWQLIKNTPRELGILFLFVTILSVLCTGVFLLSMDLSPIDAFYFVVTSLTTTGYGDINVVNESNWLKLFTIGMMIIGSGSIAVLYSILTNFIVSTKFDDLFGQQQTNMKNHVVVVGLGNLGYKLIETLLAMDIPVIATDLDSSNPFRGTLQDQIPIIVGDGRESYTLQRASVQHARAVIATTGDDGVNLSIGLAAKEINPKVKTVIQLFESTFAAKVEANLNIDRALSASLLCAPGFVAAAIFPKAVFSFFSNNRLVVLFENEQGKLEVAQVSCRKPN